MRLLRSRHRYLVTTTGNANAGTGEQGLLDATLTCSNLAALAEVDIDTILPFSTGVIGEPLPMDRLLAGLPGAFKNLSESGWAVGVCIGVGVKQLSHRYIMTRGCDSLDFGPTGDGRGT